MRYPPRVRRLREILGSLDPRLRVVFGYIGVALAMMARVAWQPGAATVGYPNVDALDTVMLRGLVARAIAHPWRIPWTNGIYFPTGYPVLQLTPNLVDHLTAALLVWLVPFPWSDNLWWLAVLALNGLCAHRLGRKLGGSEATGWAAGLAFMLSEPVAREANLHHAPQAMVFWAPLYLTSLIELRQAPTTRRALWPAVWLAMAALTYWYLGLFLALGTLVLLWGVRLRAVATLAGATAALTVPAALPMLIRWHELPLTSGASGPVPANAEALTAVPEAARFVTLHGNDLLFWLRRTPLDTANRVSLVLVAAAALGWRHAPLRRAYLALSLLGAVMLLGPYLRWGDGVVTLDGAPLSLPFGWLGRTSPVLARLTWPERWGVLLPLGLAALAAHAPRPGLWAVLIAMESFVVSGNLPLQAFSVRWQRCWRDIQETTGAVIELPLTRGYTAARVGIHQRFHGRPLVNPTVLPPGATAPPAWRAWLGKQPLVGYLQAIEAGHWPRDPGAAAVRSLRAAGVTVVAVDAEPGGPLTAGGVNRYRAALSRHLGAPIDLGCALVWWLDDKAPPPAGRADGDDWRARVAAWKAAHPEPDFDTLIDTQLSRPVSGGR